MGESNKIFIDVQIVNQRV